MRNIWLTLLLAIFSKGLFGMNYTDSLSSENQVYKFSSAKIIAPAILISYGSASLFSKDLKAFNNSVRDYTLSAFPHKSKIDNYTQYAPALAVYGLNIFGLKGKHNYRDLTLIYATSQLIVTALVQPVKHIGLEQRPDKSSFNSFPSGHTATAFSAAQLMFREYQNENLAIAILGYPVAAFTGYYRIINDRHWFGDIATGAGIGILATEIAYWVYPKLSKMLFGGFKKQAVIFFPEIQKNSLKFGLTASF